MKIDEIFHISLQTKNCQFIGCATFTWVIFNFSFLSHLTTISHLILIVVRNSQTILFFHHFRLWIFASVIDRLFYQLIQHYATIPTAFMYLKNAKSIRKTSTSDKTTTTNFCALFRLFCCSLCLTTTTSKQNHCAQNFLLVESNLNDDDDVKSRILCVRPE